MKVANLLFAVTTLACTVQAQNNPIVVPPGTATGIALAAASNYRVAHDGMWKDYEDVVILATLNGVAKTAANTGQSMSAASYGGFADQIRSVLNAQLPRNPVFVDEASCLRYAINSAMPVLNASSDPSLKGGLAALQNLKLTGLGSPIVTSRLYPADRAISSTSINAYRVIADIVQEASDLAQNDPAYAAAVSPILIDLVAFDASASYAQIQAVYPQAVPALTAPNADGSYTLNTQDLIGQYTGAINKVHSAVNAALNEMEGVILTTGNAPVKTDVSRAVALASGGSKDPCTTRQIIVASGDCSASADLENGVQGTITGISKLVGLSNSGTANQIATVGGDVVQIGKAVGQLGIISSDAGVLGTLGAAFGVLGPVGAIAGAAVSIFQSLFGGGPSNADVLKSVQQVSQQIQRLQTDMDSQFNQVNATLNNILYTLNASFTKIDFTLGQLTGDVEQIQTALLDVQTQLNQIAIYERDYAETQSYEGLMKVLDSCLNYSVNTNGGDIGQSAFFTNCESPLYIWNTLQVMDNIWAPIPKPNDYQDPNIYNFLLDNSESDVCTSCAIPFSADVNYLAQFPAQNLSLPALSNTNLPNPEMWVLGARAYLELAREWPQYGGPVNRLDDIIQVGSTLQQAVHAANSSQGPNGLVANHALYDALVTKYQNTANALYTALQGVAQTRVKALFNGGSTNGFDLWGGPNQPIPSPAVIQQLVKQPIAFDGSNAPSITPPAALDAAIPMAVKLAAELNFGTLSLRYAVGNPVTGKTVSGQSFNVTCSQGGPRFVEIIGLLKTAQSANPYFVFDRVAFYCVTPASATNAQLIQDWQNNLGGVQSSWTVNSINILPANLFQDLEQMIDSDILLPAQQQAYIDMVSAFGQAQSPVQLAAQQLSGVKTLIQAYVAFGLSQSSQTNDLLHAALYGNGAIPDGAAVEAAFQAWSKSPPKSVMDNAIVDEWGQITASIQNLRNALTAALNQIEQSGIPDSLADVDAVLSDLQAFEIAKNAGAMSACTWQLSSASSAFGSAGGQIKLTATSATGCLLTPSTGSSWITLSTTQASPTTSEVSINVASAGTGVSRAGVVLVGDQVYRIAQFQNSDACQYSLTSTGSTYGAAAITGSVGVVVSAGCPWSVTGNVPTWMTITSGKSGVGNGTVQFSLTSNPGLTARSAQVIIAGVPFFLLQTGNIVGSKMLSPTPGSTLALQVTFTWDAGTGVTGSHQLMIGTKGAGSYDVVATVVNGKSFTVKIPGNQAPLYVRLYSQDASSFATIFNDYIYTEPGAAHGGPVLPTVASHQ